MAPETYAALPSDVREFIGDNVELREEIPFGEIRVTHTSTADEFVARTRAKRKRERQNKKAGRS